MLSESELCVMTHKMNYHGLIVDWSAEEGGGGLSESILRGGVRGDRTSLNISILLANI